MDRRAKALRALLTRCSTTAGPPELCNSAKAREAEEQLCSKNALPSYVTHSPSCLPSSASGASAPPVIIMDLLGAKETPMSSTGLNVFDKTLQTTHVWLDELMEVIGPDRQVAWHVLGSVLRALRDRVPLGLAVHLGSQLPLLVRGTYYDQWHAPGQTVEQPPQSLDEFLQIVVKDLENTRPVNVRDATMAVFEILWRHVDRGQIEKVRSTMPELVRNIWQDSPEAPDVRTRSERYSDNGANEESARTRR